MRRVGFGVGFCLWLYGVPFLLVVGLIRRASPYLDNHPSAYGFSATTDSILITALVLNGVLPLAGLGLARLARDRYWTQHFAWSLSGMVLIYAVVLLIAGSTSAPLIGPTDDMAVPPTHCVARSGGHGCPGG